MTNHVVNLDLAKRLKEAGYPQESEFCWYMVPENDGTISYEIHQKRHVDYVLRNGVKVGGYECAAPLATELLERLPDKMKRKKRDIVPLHIEKRGREYSGKYDANGFTNDSLPDALAEMWLWLKEEGHV